MTKLINMKLNNRIPRSASAILLVLLVFLCAISFIPQAHRWGDTSSYYMQIQSIAEDHDIQYLPNDIDRAIETRFDDLPAGLFLIKTEDGKYFYGKEYSYALFASPFYKLFGNNGILLFNALMFYVMILMGYIYLRENNGDLKALCVSIVFFLMSTAFVYIFWIHAEIYNMFLIMSVFFLWNSYFDNNKREYLVFTSIIIGIAAVAKIPNIVLFMPLILYELYRYRFKNFALMVLTIAIVVFAFFGYFYLETGSPSFYGGNRMSYISNFPFLNGYNEINEAGSPAFSVTEGRIGALINTDNLKTIPYNLFYYFFGRFTGVMWYYPMAIFALISALMRFGGIDYVKSDPKKVLILLAISVYILFFVIVIGNNYLGGGHAVGNRYFYVYPAFLFLLGVIRYRMLIPFLLLTVITVAPIIADPIENSKRPDLHTFSMPYKYFPIEYGQLTNLPLWALAQRGEIYEIYALGTDKKHVDYLIRTKLKINSFGILLDSCYNDTTIQITANNHACQMTLDRYNAKMIILEDIYPKYSDKNGYIYKISVRSNNDVDMKLINRSSWTSDTKLLYGHGWHSLEDWNGKPTRWMENNATLLINSSENRTAELDLQVFSYRHPRTLKIYLNGHPWIQRSDLPATHFTNLMEVSAPPMNLRNGTNIITFYVPEGCDSPRDATGGKSSDPRCLSLAFQEIKLVRDILIVDEESMSASLSDGWHGLEDWDGTPTRWMENDATLMIYSNDRSIADLSFNASSFHRPRTLEIYVNDHPQHIYAEIPNNKCATVNVPRINLNKGANIVRFHVPEGCERPVDIPELNNPDSRCLSIAVQDIQIIKDILINDQESPSISLGTSWHGLEDWSGTPSRWIENDATLMIKSEENTTAELSFRVCSYNRPRTLVVYNSEDNLIGKAVVSEDFIEIEMPIDLEVGANSLRLHIPEGYEIPSEVTGGKSRDDRCLSLAFQDIKIC